jgi:hypothetical protein
MMIRRAAFSVLLLCAAACGGDSSEPPAAPGAPGAATKTGAPGAPGSTTSSAAASKFVEGKDYVVMERLRLIDPMGFDRPVEAMSVLVPRGWRSEGGVQWKSVNGCRGEIVTWQMKVVSPDGAITLQVLPPRAVGWSSDPMILETLRRSSQVGGCGVSRPFDANQRLQQIAAAELGGATITGTRRDDALMPFLDKINADANNIARQYGNNMQQSSSAIVADLAWPDGSQGLANVGVNVIVQRAVNIYGPPVEQATALAFHQAFVRFPPDRREEATRLYRMVMTSHRMNPVWQQAKESFLTQLGNREHEFRLNTIRLMGEQAKAYADEQAKLSDQRMRDWERKQASSDRQQERTIQTIREVETWKTSDGQPVELSAGYHHAWSKPDGSYILTNSSLFDPAVAFQQNWTRMEKSDK